MDAVIEFLTQAGVAVPFFYLHYSKIAFLLIALFAAIAAFDFFVCVDNCFALTVIAVVVLAGGYGVGLNAYRNTSFDDAGIRSLVKFAGSIDEAIVGELRTAMGRDPAVVQGERKART